MLRVVSLAMNKLIVLLVVLSSCYRVPVVPPELRPVTDQARAAVVVLVSCSETNMFEVGKEHPNPMNTTITWRAPSIGTGVIVRDDLVLTAAHITTCPTIPTVHVVLANGTRRRMSVIRENLKKDLALLRTSTMEGLHQDIAPPVLGVFEYMADGAQSCAEVAFPRRERLCGEAATPSRFTFATRPGNSGAAVYDPAGRLVGLVVKTYLGQKIGSGAVFSHTRIVEVPASWLR